MIAGAGTPRNPRPIQPKATHPQHSRAAQPLSQAARAVDDSASERDDPTKTENVMMKLGPGDLIEVNVYNVPELASKVRVSNGGDIYLPLVDYVHVDGLTQEEAQTLIQKTA